MVEDVLITEAGGDPGAGYESRPTLDLVERMNAADATVATAVAAAAPAIAETVDAVAARLRTGGRLVYVGAGSSGLIAALDASECEATFSTAPGQVLALVAGGPSAPRSCRRPRRTTATPESPISRQSRPARLTPSSASARADRRRTCSARSRPRAAPAPSPPASSRAPARTLGSIADHEIVVVVGPEFIAGSTRLKAGTAQKLVLNTISTVSMIRLGKTYGNLMVDVVAANDKLAERVRRIVAVATGADGRRRSTPRSPTRTATLA